MHCFNGAIHLFIFFCICVFVLVRRYRAECRLGELNAVIPQSRLTGWAGGVARVSTVNLLRTQTRSARYVHQVLKLCVDQAYTRSTMWTRT